MKSKSLHSDWSIVITLFTPTVDYCITKQPIPNSMRRGLMPLDPDSDKQQQQHQKTSNESLGIGVYSIIQPDNIQETPLPKPRSIVLSNPECVYGM